MTTKPYIYQPYIGYKSEFLNTTIDLLAEKNEEIQELNKQIYQLRKELDHWHRWLDNKETPATCKLQ